MTVLNMPIIIFDVHPVCNQTCTYCVSGSSPSNDFGAITNPDTLKKIEEFFATHGPFNVLFTGGEPLITPAISDIFEMLIQQGHIISLQSNLKSRVETFVKVVPPERTGWVLTSFHSVELKRFDSYLRNVLLLKSKGYPLAVKLVLDNALMTEFTSIYDTLVNHNLGVILSPVLYFPPDGMSWPQQYTPEQWSLIASRMTMLSSWLFFAGGFKSQGTVCYAGNQMSLLRMFNGAIHGCGHSYPLNFGNLYTNQFTPPQKAVRCGLVQCICDFHYYTGIIPKLDDSEPYKKLMSGQNEIVPFAAYLEWIEKAKVEPFLDLQAEMNGIPRQNMQPSGEYISLELMGGPGLSLPTFANTQKPWPGRLRSAVSKITHKLRHSNPF
jgi:hypothetical protein